MSAKKSFFKDPLPFKLKVFAGLFMHFAWAPLCYTHLVCVLYCAARIEGDILQSFSYYVSIFQSIIFNMCLYSML